MLIAVIPFNPDPQKLGLRVSSGSWRLKFWPYPKNKFLPLSGGLTASILLDISIVAALKKENTGFSSGMDVGGVIVSSKDIVDKVSISSGLVKVTLISKSSVLSNKLSNAWSEGSVPKYWSSIIAVDSTGCSGSSSKEGSSSSSTKLGGVTSASTKKLP
mgnify:CR=1 FL=1